MESSPHHLCANASCSMNTGSYKHTGKYFDASGYCSYCCTEGKHLTSRLQEAAGNGTIEKVSKRLIADWLKHCDQCHGREVITAHTGNGTHSGAFAFTLTKSPTDGLSEEDMIKAVKKIMNQKSCPVIKYAWYLEYGNIETKEHLHIHGMYETQKGGMIEKKHWSRAWSIWDPSTRMGAGHRGGYHRPVKSDEAYTQYIAKQNILGETGGV